MAWIMALFSMLGAFVPASEIFMVEPNKRECIYREDLTGDINRVVLTKEEQFNPFELLGIITGNGTYFAPDVPLIQGSCIARQQLTVEENRILEAKMQKEVINNALLLPRLLIFFALATIVSLYIGIATIVKNGVRVGPQQYPELHKLSQQIAARLGMRKAPDVFVIFSRSMNAFAAKLTRRRVVVLFSDTVEALIEGKRFDELEIILAHEFGHHVLGHTWLINILTLPVETVLFPLYMAWSRAREYSCDRIAIAVTHNLPAFERAFVKLAVGKLYGNVTNIDQFVKQSFEERSVSARVAEWLSTHPFLPHRIIAARKFHEKGM